MVDTASRALRWTHEVVRVGEDLAAKTGGEPVVEPKQSKYQPGKQEQIWGILLILKKIVENLTKNG